MVRNLLLTALVMCFSMIGFGQAATDCDDCPAVEVALNTIYPNPADDFIRINPSKRGDFLYHIQRSRTQTEVF